MTTEQDEGLSTEIPKKSVRITRVNPDNIRPVHANDFLVSHTAREFFLTFSQLEPLDIQNEEELEKIEKLEAIARAKIVITPDFVESVIKALSRNLDVYKVRIAENEPEE